MPGNRDDALAPVIGVMVILAIGVTFFVVYTATYLPALKQQAEIEHLKGVETGFLRFSADIEDAVTYGAQSGREGELSEQIRLGGGSFLLNPLESSGTVHVREIDRFRFTASFMDEPARSFDISLASLSYTPSNNFWIDQGYSWQYGYTNVTRPGRSVPLQGYSGDFVSRRVGNFTARLISVRNIPADNTSIEIVSLLPGENNATSGNGMARLVLDSMTSTE